MHLLHLIILKSHKTLPYTCIYSSINSYFHSFLRIFLPILCAALSLLNLFLCAFFFFWFCSFFFSKAASGFTMKSYFCCCFLSNLAASIFCLTLEYAPRNLLTSIAFFNSSNALEIKIFIRNY